MEIGVFQWTFSVFGNPTEENDYCFKLTTILVLKTSGSLKECFFVQTLYILNTLHSALYLVGIQQVRIVKGQKIETSLSLSSHHYHILSFRIKCVRYISSNMQGKDCKWNLGTFKAYVYVCIHICVRPFKSDLELEFISWFYREFYLRIFIFYLLIVLLFKGFFYQTSSRQTH